MGICSRYAIRSLLLPIALTVFGLTWQSVAIATDVVVRVKIEQTEWFGCDDGVLGPPDVYFRVNINGNELSSRGSTIYTNFSPFSVNREFSQAVDFSLGMVNISIAQWDRDGTILTGGDDHCDIKDGDGQDIELELDLAACIISGDVSGACGSTVSGRGAFRFQVNVDEPPTAPGLQTACLHDPLWPQPGETVEITAKSLDGDLGPRLADSIEIWVDDRTAPALTVADNTASYTAGPFTSETFTYGCRIIDDGLTIWTGWRTVAVGTSSVTESYNDRVPIIYTGERSSRLDFVFYPDVDSYTGTSDPTFQSDVLDVMTNTYFSDDAYLKNQDKLNFWISVDTGKTDGFADGDCTLEAPRRAWEDTGVVLHTDNLRDCAILNSRLFSAEPTSYRTVLHESGHMPFGMADEYCCDGGYFQTAPFPNVYNSIATLDVASGVSIIGCADDAVLVGKTSADCRTWDETVDWWFDPDWWTSDPAADDLMFGDTRTRQALDNRRIDWLFDVCRSAGC